MCDSESLSALLHFIDNIFYQFYYLICISLVAIKLVSYLVIDFFYAILMYTYKPILSRPKNNLNPNNKTTKTVVGMRLSNRWELPPTTTQTQNYIIEPK